MADIRTDDVNDLLRVLAALDDEDTVFALLEDLFTIREIRETSQRLAVARLLAEGKSYSVIEQLTGASATTIARVSKCLSYGSGGYRAALDVLEGDQATLADSFARLDTISDYNNAFMQLQAGNVDAVACDLSIAAYQMAGNPDAYAQIETPLSSEHYAVGFKKGDDAMAKTVSDTLKAMYADGTVQQLCEKYAQYGLSFDNWILK